MSSFLTKLMSVVRQDPRFAYEAYEFVFQALEFTQKQLGHDLPDETTDPTEPHNHVTCRQLLEGIREFGIHEFGLMAPVVFRMWGIHRSADFGEIVFNLIEAKLMSKTDEDSRAEFHGVFDIDETMTQGFRIVVEEE
jgi:uncharacterized repeat protein (TIGR04138 family)